MNEGWTPEQAKQKARADIWSTRIQLIYGASLVIFGALIKGLLLVHTLEDWTQWVEGAKWYALLYLGTYLIGGPGTDLASKWLDRKNGA